MSLRKIRLGINGFGRMGRLGLRIAWEQHPELEVVHINEPHGTAECAAHLLKFDSVHGTWNKEVTHGSGCIIVEGLRIAYTSHSSPEHIDWSKHQVDIVLECSGQFKKRAQLQYHLRGTVKKVVVSAPVKEKEGALNIVFGVNDHLYDAAKHDIVTAASCTTNCMAPAIKVIKERLGINRAMMTTIHDVTNTQRVLDKFHKNLRRARSSSTSLIPATTGSAKAIQVIFPDLKGKINGRAVRVPMQNSSLTDLVLEVKTATTEAAVNAMFKEAADGELKGILGFEKRELVSCDFVNDNRSVIVDGPSTMVVDKTFVKLFLWYDNEWGYMARMMDLAAKVGGLLQPTQSPLRSSL